MKGFLEQYGVGIFVLVLTSILIAFASPIGKTIKNDITKKVNNIEEITDDETEIAKGNYYTIVFDGNGATSGSMESMKVICGKEFKMPKCEFSKSGAEFSGFWMTKDGKVYNGLEAGVNTEYKDLTTNGKTITLYAKWGIKLDLNSFLDGTWHYSRHNYGTCDIYINGELVGKDVSDFVGFYPIGTTYEIKNITPTPGHNYLGLRYGDPLVGIISHTTYINLIFNTIT